MAKHGSDVALIRARIKSLTTREFAEFARDPYYDQRGSLRALSAKKEERVVELLCDVNNLIEQGRAVKVIEILTESERGYLADILSAAENTLQTKAILASELSSVSEEIANSTAEAPTATAESPLTLTPIAQGEPAKEAQLDNAA
jgi:hypothetical protein